MFSLKNKEFWIWNAYMKKSLIIVESPAKIKTLQKFLGKNFVFASSIGHVADLPSKEFGIDIEKDFEPHYEILPDKKDVIRNIQKMASSCEAVYLSPDPDREGEAIAWHIAKYLPKTTQVHRVSFNAITKSAVTAALQTPRQIDMALVNAQQARRLLDRIVGYKISPILSRKLQQRSGISAGRVQSVALKLVVDREHAIETFIPKEFWNISADLQDPKSQKSFSASLHAVDGKRWEKEPPENKQETDYLLIDTREKAEAVIERLKNAVYTVSKVEAKEKKRNPMPPFTTSTLQQEASRHFRFSASRTMNIAQTLYEGVEIREGEATGLITYMRTDSVRSAPEAIEAARTFIKNTYGNEYLPNTPNGYSTKKMTQDAHEAIRPTDVSLTPEALSNYLTKDQLNLYELIWKRFVASQMQPSVYDTLSVRIQTDSQVDLKASGSVLKFNGFLAVYQEKEDDDSAEDKDLCPLPPLSVGQTLNLLDLFHEQSFTKPLPRFTEASLVKELEKSGIGRPSTYAAIMDKIQRREYTVKENSRLKPTELGKVISAFLETNFPQIMNVGFTARMEDELELIADNKKPWKALIREFWDHFLPEVTSAEKEATIPRVPTDIPCPSCKKSTLTKIWAKNHYFFGCSSYPECEYKVSEEEMSFNKDDYSQDNPWDGPCPICQGPMKIRHGKFGAFLGCEKYPKCRGTVTLLKKGEASTPEFDPVPCPARGCSGKILRKKSRFNKFFYSCSEFPSCDVIGNSVDEIMEKYVDRPKTAYEKVKTKKAAGKKTGKKQLSRTSKTKKSTKLASLFIPSEALAAIIGSQPISRTDATKKLWEYIKNNSLQDPKNKKIIIPDNSLEALFGSSEPLDMLRLPKLLSQNLLKPET